MNRFILTILTTYICKTPQELDNVLLKIKELRGIVYERKTASLSHTLFSYTHR